MPRTTLPLTATQVSNVKPTDKDKTLSDGRGLQLRIKPNGSKLWYFSYTRPIDKKRTMLALGRYPDVSLARAREKAAAERRILSQGTDPKRHKEEQNRIQTRIIGNSVKEVAKSWLETKKEDVSKKYAQDVWRSFEIYLFPYAGNDPISSITAPDMIVILRPIEASGKLFVLEKLIPRINAVMAYAVNTGLIRANPLADIKAAFKKPKIKNTPSLKPEELNELLSTVAMSSIRLTTKLLIKWQLHTMVRPSEAAKTVWSEFDFDNNIWIIPAERMKGQMGKKREHRIPLTTQMLQILEAMKPISGHREFVFPADRKPTHHTNVETANTALKRLGFQGRTTAHGLRSLASTTLNEQGFEPDLIEAALSHRDDNQVRSAYNRTDYLKRRRDMMEWWNDLIENKSYYKI